MSKAHCCPPFPTALQGIEGVREGLEKSHCSLRPTVSCCSLPASKDVDSNQCKGCHWTGTNWVLYCSQKRPVECAISPLAGQSSSKKCWPPTSLPREGRNRCCIRSSRQWTFPIPCCFFPSNTGRDTAVIETTIFPVFSHRKSRLRQVTI